MPPLTAERVNVTLHVEPVLVITDRPVSLTVPTAPSELEADTVNTIVPFMVALQLEDATCVVDVFPATVKFQPGDEPLNVAAAVFAVPVEL